VIPSVRDGRERAGKDMDGFDVVAAVPAAVTEDRAAAYETMRADLVTYWSLPFYRAMIERSGFGEDIAAFDAGMAGGDVEAAKRGISDAFLDSLTAIGTPDDVRAGVARYRDAGATSPGVGAVPRTDFEATLEAAAG
jgi:alkanesulfonate monooxygenase SsuD/methylene tetrahydromethanopterin reductase-like flavin-dependent oxidoreductase (luciferase family)